MSTTKNFNSVMVTSRKSVPMPLSKSVFKKDDSAFSSLAQNLASGKSKPTVLPFRRYWQITEPQSE